MIRGLLTYITKVIILFLLYLLTGRFGLSLDAVSGFATLVWIPTGISLVTIFLFGYRLWIGIAAGACFVNILTGAPPLAALGIACGNTLEAVIGAYCLKRMGFHPTLER